MTGLKKYSRKIKTDHPRPAACPLQGRSILVVLHEKIILTQRDSQHGEASIMACFLSNQQSGKS